MPERLKNEKNRKIAKILIDFSIHQRIPEFFSISVSTPGTSMLVATFRI